MTLKNPLIIFLLRTRCLDTVWRYQSRPWKLMVRDLLLIYPGLDVPNHILIMRTTALYSLKKLMRNLKFCSEAIMLGSKIYIYLHISIPGDLCHYFLLWTEHNDALENYCIDLFHTVFLFTFLKGQIHQNACNLVFSDHCIALHMMYLPFEICKQKHCIKTEKGLIKLKAYFFISFENM